MWVTQLMLCSLFALRYRTTEESTEQHNTYHIKWISWNMWLHKCWGDTHTTVTWARISNVSISCSQQYVQKSVSHGIRNFATYVTATIHKQKTDLTLSLTNDYSKNIWQQCCQHGIAFLLRVITVLSAILQEL